jgi:predicted membrane-bound mannosyltransferase
MLPLQLFYEQGLVGLVLLGGFALMLAEWAWKARLTKAGVLGLSTLVAFSVLSLVEGALLTRATAAALAVVVAIRSIDAAATEPG